ncbi:MAG: DUF554 domain-containing protein [Clostridiales bacterium]|nr:DUF554 domain-containing protein [Clostridiales bacterium]
MLGTFVNTGTILLGSFIGLLFNRLLPERIGKTVMAGIALCVLYLGIDGALAGNNPLIAIISVAIGAILGELPDLDGRFNRFAERLEMKFKKDSGPSLAEGFVTASLVFCIGSMAIVGSLRSGLAGDHTMLYAKSTLDFVTSIFLASTLGIGVAFSAIVILLFQGSITLLAGLVSPLLGEAVIAEMTCVGSILIIGMGLNMLGLTKLKIMNYLPAIFIPIILCLFM